MRTTEGAVKLADFYTISVAAKSTFRSKQIRNNHQCKQAFRAYYVCVKVSTVRCLLQINFLKMLP